MRRNWLGLLVLMGALAIGCGDDGGTTDGGPGTDSGMTDGGATEDGGETDGGGTCTPAEREDTRALCTDGCDNDDNLFFDCGGGNPDLADFACADFCVMECPPEQQSEDENDATQCADGCDNDGNGFVDCDDNGCIGTTACPAEQSNRGCSDGMDNDGDGFTDCMDRSCFSPAVGDQEARGAQVCLREMTNEACSDGEDNDGDGFVDCADASCHGDAIVVCAPDSTDVVAEGSRDTIEARCTDDVSNGGGALPGESNTPFRGADCGDFTCLFFFDGCDEVTPENTNATCSDGVDNDGDGLTDCQDTGCVGTGPDGDIGGDDDVVFENIVVCDAARAEVEFADEAAITAAANMRCDNDEGGEAVDDDDNGFANCGDFACTGDELVTVCTEAERNAATCADEMDNDDNGFTDCGDRNCNSNPAWCPDAENGIVECSDGLDNDGNGFADCRDFSCAFSDACEGTDLNMLF